MSLSVSNYILVPLFNIDMSLFCIDMNIEAHFYRYINISDINDSSNRNAGNFSRKIVGLAVQIIERHVVQYDQEHHVNKREFM